MEDIFLSSKVWTVITCYFQPLNIINGSVILTAERAMANIHADIQALLNEMQSSGSGNPIEELGEQCFPQYHGSRSDSSQIQGSTLQHFVDESHGQQLAGHCVFQSLEDLSTNCPVDPCRNIDKKLSSVFS